MPMCSKRAGKNAARSLPRRPSAVLKMMSGSSASSLAATRLSGPFRLTGCTSCPPDASAAVMRSTVSFVSYSASSRASLVFRLWQKAMRRNEVIDLGSPASGVDRRRRAVRGNCCGLHLGLLGWHHLREVRQDLLLLEPGRPEARALPVVDLAPPSHPVRALRDDAGLLAGGERRHPAAARPRWPRGAGRPPPP